MICEGVIDWWLQIAGKKPERGTQKCEVKIEDSNILITAPDNGLFAEVIYRGKEVESGHYILREDSCGVRGDHASLHGFKGFMNEGYLEGYFCGDGEVGMWRITLGKKKGRK